MGFHNFHIIGLSISASSVICLVTHSRFKFSTASFSPPGRHFFSSQYTELMRETGDKVQKMFDKALEV